MTSKNGWLSLAGLFWLEEGENGFGADESNTILFPGDRAPDFIGSFFLDNGQVTIRIKPDIKVLHGDTPVTEMILQDDEKGEPTVLTCGSLSWHVIKRDNRYGIRLKDSENPKIKEFKGIERFPVSKRWRIKAKYLPYDPPKNISIVNVLGKVSEEPSPGALKFKIYGKTYRLDSLGEPDDEELFIVFGDRTNGFETYGGGRFLYVKKPDKKGMTYVDFNKAYNPPCAFTEFATCPMPPSQNKLPVKITAGEKSYKDALH
ncbi:MAG: DUF1684 domain-containing protein [Acidobacteriota bacterium]